MLVMVMIRPSLPPHVGHGGLCAKQDAAGVDVERPIPRLGVDLGDRLDHAASGVADEDVDATQLAGGVVHQATDFIFLGDISLNDRSLGAERFDLGGSLLGVFAMAEEVDGDVAAALCEG